MTAKQWLIFAFAAFVQCEQTLISNISTSVNNWVKETPRLTDVHEGGFRRGRRRVLLDALIHLGQLYIGLDLWQELVHQRTLICKRVKTKCYTGTFVCSYILFPDSLTFRLLARTDTSGTRLRRFTSRVSINAVTTLVIRILIKNNSGVTPLFSVRTVSLVSP